MNEVRSRAFALPAVLLVVVLLSVLVAGFMTTIGIDRATSNAYANIRRAELAAEAAVEAGITRTVQAIRAQPYHAVGYRRLEVPDAENGGIELIVPVIVSADPLARPAMPTETYLISTPDLNAFPDTAVAGDLADLDLEKDLGAPVDEEFAYLTPWLYLRERPGAESDSSNPIIARFAFRVDDENAKIDFGFVGNDSNEGAYRRDFGLPPMDIDIGAIPLLDQQPLGDDPASHAANTALMTLRNMLPIFEPRFLNRVEGLSPTIYDDTAGFYSTIFSRSNELSFQGRRRTNLNMLVTGTADADIVREQVRQIADIIKGAIPDFGQRFIPGPASGGMADLYLDKLAVNIRDYIDADHQPTIIDAQGNVLPTEEPEVPWPAGTPPHAVGKEAIPYLTEYVWTGREIVWKQVGPAVEFDIEMDWYFEFANVTTIELSLLEGTFLRVVDRPGWDLSTYGTLTPPDFRLDLSDITIPPGATVVVTTAPEGTPLPPNLLQPKAVLVRRPVPDEARRFSGSTDSHDKKESITLPLLNPEDNPAAAAFWGNESGYYGSTRHLVLGGGEAVVFTGENAGEETPAVVYAAALAGTSNAPAGNTSGDPRSLGELLADPPTAAAFPFQPTLSNGQLPGASTLGGLASPLTDPGYWPDFSPAFTDTPATAPAVQQDSPMVTIGELGNIYDPHRAPADEPEAARGGGRTLRVGQPDDVAGGARFSERWMRSAWRLTDIFSAYSNLTPTAPAIYRGKLNINGALRDGGVALRGVLRDFRFLAAPESDPALAEASLPEKDIDEFVASVLEYLEDEGPFMERGELSEISYFAPGSSVADRPVAALNDRGREEIFRRVVELVTTRSAAFTVHGLGEAVKQLPDGSLKPLARRRISMTFLLEPQIDEAPEAVVTGYLVRRVFETR